MTTQPKDLTAYIETHFEISAYLMAEKETAHRQTQK